MASETAARSFDALEGTPAWLPALTPDAFEWTTEFPDARPVLRCSIDSDDLCCNPWNLLQLYPAELTALVRAVEPARRASMYAGPIVQTQALTGATVLDALEGFVQADCWAVHVTTADRAPVRTAADLRDSGKSDARDEEGFMASLKQDLDDGRVVHCVMFGQAPHMLVLFQKIGEDSYIRTRVEEHKT